MTNRDFNRNSIKCADGLKKDKHYSVYIKEDSTGYSYKTVFSKFFKGQDLEYVIIKEPYITNEIQYENLVQFCEVMRTSSIKIKKIELQTQLNSKQCNFNNFPLAVKLNEIQETLANHKDKPIKFVFRYNKTLHDREIELSNGWFIKIGRGLDYLKKEEMKPKKNPKKIKESYKNVDYDNEDNDLDNEDNEIASPKPGKCFPKPIFFSPKRPPLPYTKKLALEPPKISNHDKLKCRETTIDIFHKDAIINCRY